MDSFLRTANAFAAGFLRYDRLDRAISLGAMSTGLNSYARFSDAPYRSSTSDSDSDAPPLSLGATFSTDPPTYALTAAQATATPSDVVDDSSRPTPSHPMLLPLRLLQLRLLMFFLLLLRSILLLLLLQMSLLFQ